MPSNDSSISGSDALEARAIAGSLLVGSLQVGSLLAGLPLAGLLLNGPLPEARATAGSLLVGSLSAEGMTNIASVTLASPSAQTRMTSRRSSSTLPTSSRARLPTRLRGAQGGLSARAELKASSSSEAEAKRSAGDLLRARATTPSRKASCGILDESKGASANKMRRMVSASWLPRNKRSLVSVSQITTPIEKTSQRWS